MSEPGKISFRARAQQLRDYSGLRFGNITPSDIDGAVDFGGRCFIFLEYKLAGAPIPYGQRLLYERICDALTTSETTSSAIIAEHNQPADTDINCAGALAVEYRWDGEWHKLSPGMPVRTLIESLKDIPPRFYF
jgi:hypothetical protein